MATPKEVILFGAAPSSYCTMVHHALRLKRVAYDYVEVDLKNKSEEFLKVNPVHKKVPTLVVDGKPIPESLVILQYVDETWKDPPLMPQDAYSRFKVRFWADFIYQKIIPVTYAIALNAGEEQKKAVKEFLALQKILEDGIEKDVHVQQGPFIHGEQPGLLDIIVVQCMTGLKRLEQMCDGVKLLDEAQIPHLYSYMEAFAEIPVVKETDLMLSRYLNA